VSHFPQNATVGVSALAGGSAASGGGSNGSASRAVRLPSVGESSCAYTRSHPLTPLLTRPRVCCSHPASNEAGRAAREPHARTSAHAHRDPGLHKRLKRQSTASRAASDSTGKDWQARPARDTPRVAHTAHPGGERIPQTRFPGIRNQRRACSSMVAVRMSPESIDLPSGSGRTERS